MKSTKSAPNHKHLFITGLLYPGFLGAFIIDSVGAWSDTSIIERFLLLFLALHYIGDFLYTADDDCKKIYNTPRMIIDLLLVVIIFLSFKAITSTPISTNYEIVWMLLCFFKVLNFVWELWGVKDPRFKSAVIMDSGFLVVYLVGFLFFSNVVYLLAVVVLIDALMYLLWNKIAPVQTNTNA